jgi:ubiquitin C-terminal hydrolase
MDGDEMPNCAKCKTRRKSTKTFTIQRFPKYLVIRILLQRTTTKNLTNLFSILFFHKFSLTKRFFVLYRFETLFRDQVEQVNEHCRISDWRT